ncbi:hypothetical protein T492DRAFT_893233 [Pavlovales sp. CCMP2436]|nr:hypothetical protein T492DRAFT_893233 [Pavlovales sp. CCMP2436]
MHGLLLSKVAARTSLAASSAVPGGLLVLRGGRSLGPLTPEKMVDFNIVVGILYALFFLMPSSDVPACLYGKMHALYGSSVIFWVGYTMAIVAALHAFLRFRLETPATQHLQFYALQFAVTALVHLYKLTEGEIVSHDEILWLTPMALVSAYLVSGA